MSFVTSLDFVVNLSPGSGPCPQLLNFSFLCLSCPCELWQSILHLVPVVVANMGLRLYTVGTWEISASWLYDMGLMVSYIITSFIHFERVLLCLTKH